MLQRNQETTFANWQIEPLDNEGVHVTGRYLHPMTPRRVSGSLALVAIFAPFMLHQPGSGLGGFVTVAVVFAIFCFAVVAPLARRFLRRKIDVQVYPEKLLVKETLGSKVYPRTVPMEFRVEPHRKGVEEARREQRKGRAQYTTFRDAVEVILQYGERRVALAAMTLKDIDKANALAFRLQDICERQVDVLRRMAEGAGGQAASSRARDFGPEPELR